MRRLPLIASGSVVLALPGIAITAAALGDSPNLSSEGNEERQSARLKFISREPKSPSGTSFSINWRDPAEPEGKPYSVATIIVRLHRGTRIDTSVPQQCRASDLELQLRGAAACPEASRVGGGEIVSDTGSTAVFPRLIPNDVSNFNNEGELLGVAQPREPNPPINAVTRSKIRGTTLVVNFPAFPGNPPPDNFTALRTLRLKGDRIVREGRPYLRTPPACPRSRRWTNRLTFIYRDGVEQKVRSRSPCRPAG